jgi:hypothetical protein
MPFSAVDDPTTDTCQREPPGAVPGSGKASLPWPDAGHGIYYYYAIMCGNGDKSSGFRPRPPTFVEPQLAAERGIMVTACTDQAEGVMEEQPDGSGRFTRVVLRPTVTLTPAPIGSAPARCITSRTRNASSLIS